MVTINTIKINTILVLILLLMPGCNFFTLENLNKGQVIEIGSLKSYNIWVYLCGLTQDFDSPQEVENRNILDLIGKNLNIKFLAIKPKTRCTEFANKLCWPHNHPEETLNTYQYILATIKGINISGFIGFSNGGFFLNKLAQMMELNKPIISIGSAGFLENSSFKNNLYLLIGKKDTYHYSGALEFYKKSKGTRLQVSLIEYEEGHTIPFKTLENLLIAALAV